MFKKIAKISALVGYTYVVATLSYCMGVRYIKMAMEEELDNTATEIAKAATADL